MLTADTGGAGDTPEEELGLKLEIEQVITSALPATLAPSCQVNISEISPAQVPIIWLEMMVSLVTLFTSALSGCLPWTEGRTKPAH